MNSVTFNFYGCVLELQDSTDKFQKVLKNISSDFEFFQSQFTAPQIKIVLCSEFQKPPQKSLPRFKTKRFTAYKNADQRITDYGQGLYVTSSQTSKERYFEIHGASENEVYEATYNALLSSVGEALDRKGLHRVHALGFSYKKKGTLVILPCGGGKSALAALFQKNPEISLYSDETPLLQKGQITPFPLRLALKENVAQALHLKPDQERVLKRKHFGEKFLFDIPKDKVAKTAPLKLIIVGKKSKISTPLLEKASWFTGFISLWWSMVVGLGLPQMAEHMLRANAPLIRIAFSRLRESLRMLKEAQVLVFYYSDDVFLNAEALINNPYI